MKTLLKPVAVLENHALMPMSNWVLRLAMTLEAGARRLSGGAPQPGRPPHSHATTQLWGHGGQRAPEQPCSWFSANRASDKSFVLSALKACNQKWKAATCSAGAERRGNRRRGRVSWGAEVIGAETEFRLFVWDVSV